MTERILCTHALSSWEELHSAGMESSRRTGIGRYYTWHSRSTKERSSCRRITNDDILQPIIAYVEIHDLQHNGRRATRVSASPLLWVLLVVPSPLTTVPVSGNVGFRQSIERIWERCRWINYALSQLSKFVTARILLRSESGCGRLKWQHIVYRNSQPLSLFTLPHNYLKIDLCQATHLCAFLIENRIKLEKIFQIVTISTLSYFLRYLHKLYLLIIYLFIYFIFITNIKLKTLIIRPFLATISWNLILSIVLFQQYSLSDVQMRREILTVGDVFGNAISKHRCRDLNFPLRGRTSTREIVTRVVSRCVRNQFLTFQVFRESFV